jgi:hypothetical protein
MAQLRGRVEESSRRHEQIRGDIRAIKAENANIHHLLRELR